MPNPRVIAEQVTELYTWIDEQLRVHAARAGICRACGDCCHFEAYDHRLYVTSAEVIAFAEAVGPASLRTLSQGVCPYLVEKKCAVHLHRFCACRIFCCTGDADVQAQLSEQALVRLKAICIRNHLPYRYMDLKAALEWSCEKYQGFTIAPSVETNRPGSSAGR